MNVRSTFNRKQNSQIDNGDLLAKLGLLFIGNQGKYE